MRRFLVGTWIMMSALLVGAAPAAAQLSANVQISWHWSDDGWRSSGPVLDGYVHWSDAPDRRAVRYEHVPVRARIVPVSRAGFRVPPGHMPPPGLCRVWFMGVPPGHQPPPQSCAGAFRSHRGADVVILHSPSRYDREGRGYDRWADWDDDEYRDDDDRDEDRWDDRDDRRGHDRKPRRGRGRGGR